MEQLKDGLVDIGAISAELTKTVLGPYVQFDRARQEFVFTEAWQGLNNEMKILAYLIGRKGMRANSHLSDEEAAAPKAVKEHTRMPSGSVDYSLKVLSDRKLVAKTESGKYYVPSAKLLVVKGLMEAARKGEGTEKVSRRRGKRVRQATARRKASE